MCFVSEILCVQIDFSGTTKPVFLIPSNMSFKISSNIFKENIGSHHGTFQDLRNTNALFICNTV